MSLNNCFAEQGPSSPQFALQGDEAVCTGDGFTLTACNWSLGKEDGLSAILSFRNGATDPIKDRVKFGLAKSRERFIKKIPESYRAGFESILLELENYLLTNEAKSRIQTEDPNVEIEWKSGPYRMVDGAMYRIKRSSDGDTNVRLCNFSAEIVAEEIHDDGAEESRRFIIHGKLASGKQLPIARVAAGQFGSMGWVLNQFGSEAVIAAGPAAKDGLREAIQLRSENTVRSHVYCHTGWRQINGLWVFMTASGAIGSSDSIKVDLGTDLTRYQLPLEPEDVVGAVKASLRLLKIAPLSVTAPLWAATYRAPLASLFSMDFSIWVVGPTGSLKSSVTALSQAHFGEFERTSLPGAWSSTANQLERRAFLLKDVLFVVDDYAPGALDSKELEIKASRLLRAQGNLSARGRLRADLSERPACPPRGLIIATGEQHPPAQSILARTVLVEARRTGIDFDALTNAQRNQMLLSHALSGYISWLIPQMNDMPAVLKQTFLDTRASINADCAHLRIPEALAHLWLGLSCGLRYAEEIKACSSIEARDLKKKCWDALLEIGQRQGQIVEEK